MLKVHREGIFTKDLQFYSFSITTEKFLIVHVSKQGLSGTFKVNIDSNLRITSNIGSTIQQSTSMPTHHKQVLQQRQP